MREPRADWSSDIEHIWQLIYRLGFYRGGPVLMSALSGVSDLYFSTLFGEERDVFSDEMVG